MPTKPVDARLCFLEPVRVMLDHESGALFLRHRVLGDLCQCFEVVLPRGSWSEEQQHGRRSNAAETVYAALGHEEKIAGVPGVPAPAVVQLHLAVEDEERL